jgi:hypothetical protein
MSKQILILVCFFTLISECYSQDKTKDDLLRDLVKENGQAEVVIPFDRYADLSLLSGNVSIASVREGEIRIFLSSLTVGWFISQNYKYSIIQPVEVKGISTAESIEEAMEWDYYPTYTQYIAMMHKFADDYPSLCRLDTIGTTNNGKLVLALKISDNAPREDHAGYICAPSDHFFFGDPENLKAFCDEARNCVYQYRTSTFSIVQRIMVSCHVELSAPVMRGLRKSSWQGDANR